jgi:hypothetical protein
MRRRRPAAKAIADPFARTGKSEENGTIRSMRILEAKTAGERVAGRRRLSLKRTTAS